MPPRPKATVVRIFRSLLQTRRRGRREVLETGVRAALNDWASPFVVTEGLAEGCASGRAAGGGGFSEFIDPYTSVVKGQTFQVEVQRHASRQVAEPDLVHVGLGAIEAAQGI